MNRRIYIGRASANPLVQFLSFVLVGLGLVAAVLMGAVFLSIILTVAVLIGAVVWVRLWWLSRKIRRRMGAAPDREFSETDTSGRRVIDVEYTVVEERDSSKRDE